ncbi:MAG: glycosyltransferase family 2 protein [Candidatus Shapirobacteria bacterium]|nr:glycosyltransferase family 2 protein [Candidatus Shapirobacteria bacterium]
MAINKIPLSIIILAGNEEKMIVDCLKTCSWAEEIILVAANSTDTTVTLAKKTISTIKIVKTFDEYNKNFSKWRNLGFKTSTQKWILYIDADERISLKLKKKITEIVTNTSLCSHYAISRANHFLGQRVRYGGTYPDYVKRLFDRNFFQGYKGILHEQPVITGELGYIDTDLFHYTHRDLTSMVDKTLVWTDTEAQALFKSGHPPVVWWRFIRMMLTKGWERLIKQQMWRDSEVGWVSIIFESFNTFLIYARLWELQQKQNQKI